MGREPLKAASNSWTTPERLYGTTAVGASAIKTLQRAAARRGRAAGGEARRKVRGPDPFAVAVRVALSKLGRRPYELAAAAGENKDKVYGWLNGRRSVRACTAARLLAACGLGIVVDPGMAKGLGVAPLSAKAGAGCGSGGAVGASCERGAA